MLKRFFSQLGGELRDAWRGFLGDIRTSAFYKKLSVGLVIGIAAITPGLSGGVIAAATGIYEPSVRAICDLPKRLAKSTLYLLPLGIGLVLGVGGFANVMKMLFEKWPFSVLFVFLGLVTGSIPALIEEAAEGGFKKRYLLFSLLGFGFIALFDYLSGGTVTGAVSELTAGKLLLCGAILSFGTIVPGISSSFLMVYMGVYDQLLADVTALNMRTLFLLVLGFGLMSILLIKLVEMLFRKFRAPAYFTVLGFLLGSMVMVFPGLRVGTGLFVDLGLFAAGTAGSFLLLYHGKRVTAGK